MSTNPYTPILFYSERCPNSKEVIGTIQALNKASLFRFVSVDTTPRHLMPPELKSVPTVIFPDSKQVLVGKANIFAHLSKPVQSRREVPTARAEPAKPAEPLFWSFNESTMSSGYSSFDGTTKTPEDQLRFSYLDGELKTTGQDFAGAGAGSGAGGAGAAVPEGASKTGRNADIQSSLERLQSTRDAEYATVSRQ
uniref:Glutaredoxin domain-containing protein n=1 Tax=viral metagenome TaxID=1070528 RepID=A0A6C0HKG0_9ZZZZ